MNQTIKIIGTVVLLCAFLLTAGCPKEAVKWFRLSAEQGYGPAMAHLREIEGL
jgi:TPR repeat protein